MRHGALNLPDGDSSSWDRLSLELLRSHAAESVDTIDGGEVSLGTISLLFQKFQHCSLRLLPLLQLHFPFIATTGKLILVV